MFHRPRTWKLSPLVFLLLAFVLTVTGCAREATENLAEAGKDLEQAWRAERDAAVEEMKKGLDATSKQIADMRARAAELEGEAAGEAAAAWNAMADRLEDASDLAAREVEALQSAGADSWEATKEATEKAAADLERAGKRTAALAAGTKDEFVAEARAALEEGEKELEWARQQLAAADDAAREDWQQLVDSLEEKQKATAAELAKIENAGEEAWSDLWHGFVAAYHDLRDASARAVDEFGDL